MTGARFLHGRGADGAHLGRLGGVKREMGESPTPARVVGDWFVDLALAYLGGLMIGAPAGLAATWFTRNDLTLTIVIVLSMMGVLVVRRARRAASGTD